MKPVFISSWPRSKSDLANSSALWRDVISASAEARASLALCTLAWAARSCASYSGEEILAMTWPCATFDPSSTVTSARRPAYFDDTSTCVASMRPLDLTMPAGRVSPRSRAIRFLMKPSACAEPIGVSPPPGPAPRESGRATAPIRAAAVAARQINVMVALLRKRFRGSLRSSRSSRRHPDPSSSGALLGKPNSVVKERKDAGREAFGGEGASQVEDDARRGRTRAAGQAVGQVLRTRARPAPCRTGQAAALGGREGPQGLRRVRGP